MGVAPPHQTHTKCPAKPSAAGGNALGCQRHYSRAPAVFDDSVDTTACFRGCRLKVTGGIQMPTALNSWMLFSGEVPSEGGAATPEAEEARRRSQLHTPAACRLRFESAHPAGSGLRPLGHRLRVADSLRRLASVTRGLGPGLFSSRRPGGGRYWRRRRSRPGARMTRAWRPLAVLTNTPGRLSGARERPDSRARVSHLRICRSAMPRLPLTLRLKHSALQRLELLGCGRPWCTAAQSLPIMRSSSGQALLDLACGQDVADRCDPLFSVCRLSEWWEAGRSLSPVSF